MKNLKNIVAFTGLSLLVYACGRPDYPKPEITNAVIAPLARTNANNARIAVFNALVDLTPDEGNPLAVLEVAVDGVPLANPNGTRGLIWSRQFTLDASNTVVPLVRKFPAPAILPIGIPGALQQSSQYLGNPFTVFTQAVPTVIINNVEVTPAIQETGVFVSAGRRDITFLDRNGNLSANGNLRANANLNAGSLTTIFLRGRIGVTDARQADAMATNVITETIPVPTLGNAAVRFLNLAVDLTNDVRLLDATTKAPLLRFPTAPPNTRFVLDRTVGTTPFKLDSLRNTRDSITSSRRYNASASTVSNAQIAIERTSDNTLIPGYSVALNFNNFIPITAATYPINFYGINRRTLAGILPISPSFALLAGGVYTIVLHGSSQTGYKCDLIRHN